MFTWAGVLVGMAQQCLVLLENRPIALTLPVFLCRAQTEKTAVTPSHIS